jgi:hypothetical protein
MLPLFFKLVLNAVEVNIGMEMYRTNQLINTKKLQEKKKGTDVKVQSVSGRGGVSCNGQIVQFLGTDNDSA